MRSACSVRTVAAALGGIISTAFRPKMLAHSFMVALMNPGHYASEIWLLGISLACFFVIWGQRRHHQRRIGVSSLGGAQVKHPEAIAFEAASDIPTRSITKACPSQAGKDISSGFDTAGNFRAWSLLAPSLTKPMPISTPIETRILFNECTPVAASHSTCDNCSFRRSASVYHT